MSTKGNYHDRQLVESACESIGKVIQPGDVVTQIGHHEWWQLPAVITHFSIQYYQRRLFGKSSNWKDTHAMLFLDAQNTFSIEMPRATLKPLKEYCLSNMSIYRLRLIELEPSHVELLQHAALEMVGEYYDIGQALDIFVNLMLGYEHKRRLKFFDMGRKKKVCSVGVRAAYEYLYQIQLLKPPMAEGKWLFNTLDPQKWPEKLLAEFNGTDVEKTAPAHFANSELFCHEFDLVAKFNGGKQSYPAET